MGRLFPSLLINKLARSKSRYGRIRILEPVHSLFWLIPMPGTSVPGDLKIDLGIQPNTNRLPEVIYPMQRDNGRGEVQYNAQVEFDKQDFFKVRVHVQSSAGSGDVLSQVEATPQGFGRWDLLFYLLPFLFIAAMFYRGGKKETKKTNGANGCRRSSCFLILRKP